MRTRFAALVCLVVLLPTAAPATPRALGETRTFTRVEHPGVPEGIAVNHQGDRVYVGTNAPVYGNPGAAPSKVFVYAADTGQKLNEYEVQGQNLGETHGIVGFAPGKQDVLYVGDRNPGRILRIDFGSSEVVQSTYAELPDLQPCSLTTGPCSATSTDLPPYPDGLVFDHRGNLYVSDFQQAAIFKIPAGGGNPEVWFTDQRLESPFGPNGLAIDKGKGTLYLAMTGAALPPLTSRGAIYTLPLESAPTAESLQTFFEYKEPAAGPDGIAFGKSGRLYVALAGANAISVLSPGGKEVLRFPGALANAQQEVPYDMPASIAFNDKRRSILVTNHTYFTGNSEHWAVLESFVDDTALQLYEPN